MQSSAIGRDTDFLRSVSEDWLNIWEHVPRVHFFIKDLNGRIMACNRSFSILMGGDLEKDILYHTAFDLCSPNLAIRYTQDDQLVFSGKEIIEKYEPNVGDREGVYWYLTTKLPIRSCSGSVIGLVGITRAVSSVSEFSNELGPVLDYIHNCYSTRINFHKLASNANMSVGTMERRFKTYFGISPLQYTMRHRVTIAAEYLLSTNLSIAEIATIVGFYDQAALTRHFRKHKCCTPRIFRVRYCKSERCKGGSQ